MSVVDVADDVRQRPEWAADGSGVIVEQRERRFVLRPDGTLASVDESVESCQTRLRPGATGRCSRAA